MSKLLILDTETGGLDSEEDALLSMGLVVWEDGSIVDQKEILVHSGLLTVKESALAVNRINLEKHNSVALPRREAVQELLGFIEEHFRPRENVVICGHNVSFDIAFLKRLFRSSPADYSAIFSHRSLDTYSVAQFMVLTGELEDYCLSLDGLIKYFKIEIKDENRHTALGDAIATAQVLSAMVDSQSFDWGD